MNVISCLAPILIVGGVLVGVWVVSQIVDAIKRISSIRLHEWVAYRTPVRRLALAVGMILLLATAVRYIHFVPCAGPKEVTCNCK